MAAASAVSRKLNSFCATASCSSPSDPSALLDDRQLATALVQPRVPEPNARMGRQQRHQVLVVLGEARAVALVRNVDRTEDHVVGNDGNTEERRQHRVRRRPPLEPVVGTDVIRAIRRTPLQEDAEQSVAAWRRPNGLPLRVVLIRR